MQQQKEIVFWENQTIGGLLINAIRSQNKRPIKFFGAIAVLREDEMALLYILDVRRFLVTPEAELLS